MNRPIVGVVALVMILAVVWGGLYIGGAFDGAGPTAEALGPIPTADPKDIVCVNGSETWIVPPDTQPFELVGKVYHSGDTLRIRDC